jgi:hypothetical protein
MASNASRRSSHTPEPTSGTVVECGQTSANALGSNGSLFMKLNGRTTLTCVLTEAWRPVSSAETPLVHRRRFCAHSGPRSGHLCGCGSGMLLRLCRLLLYSDAHQSAPRTPGPAGSPKDGREALAGCGRSSSPTGGAGRDGSDQRDRGSSGRPICSPARIVSTPMEVMAALPSATLLHISCDVLQDPWQPLRTSLYLSDDGMCRTSWSSI